MKGLTLLTLIYSLSLLAAAPRVAASEKPCFKTFVQYHWLIDLRKHTLKRLAKADETFTTCEVFPKDAADNIEIAAIAPSGKTIFEKTMFVQLKDYFDTIAAVNAGDANANEPKRYRGGVVPAEEVIVTAAVPESIARLERPVKLRIVSIRDRQMLAEGVL